MTEKAALLTRRTPFPSNVPHIFPPDEGKHGTLFACGAIFGECARPRAHAHVECERTGIRFARSEPTRAHTHRVRPGHSLPLELIRGRTACVSSQRVACMFLSVCQRVGDPALGVVLGANKLSESFWLRSWMSRFSKTYHLRWRSTCRCGVRALCTFPDDRGLGRQGI